MGGDGLRDNVFPGPAVALDGPAPTPMAWPFQWFWRINACEPREMLMQMFKWRGRWCRTAVARRSLVLRSLFQLNATLSTTSSTSSCRAACSQSLLYSRIYFSPAALRDWQSVRTSQQLGLILFSLLWFLARDSKLSALYAIANPSVCLSVTPGGSVQNGWSFRIMQFSPYSRPSPTPLVFAG